MLEGPGTTAYLRVAYHAPSAREADFFPMVILSTHLTGVPGLDLFGGGPPNRSSQLYRALVADGLAAGVSGALYPMLDPYLYDIGAVVRAGQSLKGVEDALDAEVDRLLQEPMAAEDLHRAIKQARAQFAYSMESVTNQGFWLGLSSIVADVDWFPLFLEKLAAVTLDDVTRAAQLYLSRRNRTVGHYLPQGASAPGEAGREP